MQQNYFITGIGTDIGKTIASAILTEALKADYWKPVQAGALDNTDSMFIKKMLSNTKSVIHPETHRLTIPASPHMAAQADKISIRLSDFIIPKTDNKLIVEGAGGLLVPLNNEGDTIADLIQFLNMETIVVSQNYLGSINHTLLTIEALHARNIKIKGIIFNGQENKATEDIILKKTGVDLIAHIPQLIEITKESIREQALILRQ